jgi:hypothetical protein
MRSVSVPVPGPCVVVRNPVPEMVTSKSVVLLALVNDLVVEAPSGPVSGPEKGTPTIPDEPGAPGNPGVPCGPVAPRKDALARPEILLRVTAPFFNWTVPTDPAGSVAAA